jgi:hypothetical protein
MLMLYIYSPSYITFNHFHSIVFFVVVVVVVVFVVVVVVLFFFVLFFFVFVLLLTSIIHVDIRNPCSSVLFVIYFPLQLIICRLWSTCKVVLSVLLIYHYKSIYNHPCFYRYYSIQD